MNEVFIFSFLFAFDCATVNLGFAKFSDEDAEKFKILHWFSFNHPLRDWASISMDRRTLLFVISLGLTLFLVNLYFERGRQESVKEWREQQKAKILKEKETLTTLINEKTIKKDDLPIVNIYADSDSRNFLNTGIRIKETILTLSWDKTPPQNVFIEGEAYTLTFSPEKIREPLLYSREKDAVLPIGELPHFGHYDLQLLFLYPLQPKQPPLATLGNYIDGRFSIPLLQLQKIDKELGEEAPPSEEKIPGNALVLMNTPEGLLPAAVYHQKTQSLIFLDRFSGLNTSIVKSEVLAEEGDAVEEKYFVVENPFLQLVFSNRGGALAEINLPFKSEKDQKSVVKEIQFDRDILDNHPANARFPEKSYFTAGDSSTGPFVEHPQGKLGGYYPLIRRSLIQKEGRKSIEVLPEYYALNIVSEYPEMAELTYEVAFFDPHRIVFEATQRNRRIRKTYTIGKENPVAPYVVDLTIDIEGDSRGLWLTSGIPEVEWISNAPAPALKYRITRRGKPEVVNMEKPKESVTISALFPDWICNSNGFFGTIMDPLTEINPGIKVNYVPGTIAPSRLVLIDEEYERFPLKSLPGYMMLLPLNSLGGSMHFRIFAGPFSSGILNTVDAIFTDPATGYNPDYIASQSFHGWFAFISAPFSKFLFILMRFFHSLTGSWGFSIILLTVALRLMLYPLNAWSMKSMVRMKAIAPELQKIQEKYKKDPNKVRLETMNLYRDKGVNPISGCFPMIIQMPFLIGMFDLLKSTFELRGASFIPGWIDNLAAPDILFSWSRPIFFIGTQFHLLPVLLWGVMYLQQRLMSTFPSDTSKLTGEQRQQKMMGNLFTIVFPVMFYHFPSGLNIYWLSSMLLANLQQWWTTKRQTQAISDQELKPSLVKKKEKRKKRQSLS
ncbi:MAG: membrane protein insertase YidC [Waddliaceae bacterium]